MTWLDITQTLEPGMTVWPGDVNFTSHGSSSIVSGDPCDVNSISLSLHAGTHADAPRHFRRGGPDIAACALEAFLGPALVVDVRGERPVSLAAIARLASPHPPRLLLKTGTGVEQGWHEEFSYLATEAAAELVRRGILLVGLDTPSVDEARSTSWPAHRLLADAGVVVLENLRLADVDPGPYELVALPLKLRNLEASPVRAALRRPVRTDRASVSE